MALPTLTADGLLRKYGPDTATNNTAGTFSAEMDRNVIEVTIPDLTKVTSTDGSWLLSDQVFFPKNSRIEEVQVVTETAATGSGAVLNIGLIRTNLTTEIDYNGLVAAIAQTALTPAGKTTIIRTGDTYAGALLGTTTSNTGYIVADYDTAAFTAGKLVVRIYFRAV